MIEGEVHSDPWERRPEEDHRSYEWFCHYRDQPPAQRSLKTTADWADNSIADIRAVARKYEWDPRAHAWDDYTDLLRRRRALAESQSMVERHARMAATMQATLMALPMALARDMNRPDFALDLTAREDGDDVSPAERERARRREQFLRLQRTVTQNAMAFRVLADIERISRGLPTEIRETLVQKATPEALRDEIRRLIANPAALRAATLAAIAGSPSVGAGTAGARDGAQSGAVAAGAPPGDAQSGADGS